MYVLWQKSRPTLFCAESGRSWGLLRWLPQLELTSALSRQRGRGRGCAGKGCLPSPVPQAGSPGPLPCWPGREGHDTGLALWHCWGGWGHSPRVAPAHVAVSPGPVCSVSMPQDRFGELPVPGVRGVWTRLLPWHTLLLSLSLPVLAGGHLSLPGFCFREPQTLGRALPLPAYTVLTTSMCSEPGAPGMPGRGGGCCER